MKREIQSSQICIFFPDFLANFKINLYLCREIINNFYMLGHNIPKPVATGKIARDIREAVKQSFSQSGHEENSDLQKRKYVIIWK